ncbi:synapsin-1-like [Odocoileus virginianus]|uniref:Synapsin-1-like n=1 Tax=Odocoileus virginianus TaxID=9874 RepID=A0ABM4IA10_ODOVR
MSSVSTQVLRLDRADAETAAEAARGSQLCQTQAGQGCHGGTLPAGNVSSALSFCRSSCLVGGSSSKKEEKIQFAVQTPPNKGIKTLNHSADKTGGRKERERPCRSLLCCRRFPSSQPAASVRPLAPGCRREVASAPSQPGTPPNRHLAQADPYPRGCHLRLCAEGLGEAKKLLRWALPPRERRSCNPNTRPQARPSARPLRRAAPRGDRRPEPQRASQPAPPPDLLRPRSPRRSVCARAASTRCRPFWVLGGYFPSGPTSLPVKEREVRAGPPPRPPPPASSCHFGEHPRPTGRARRPQPRRSRPGGRRKVPPRLF